MCGKGPDREALVGASNVRSLEETFPSFRPPPVPLEDDPEEDSGSSEDDAPRKWPKSSSEDAHHTTPLPASALAMSRPWRALHASASSSFT